MAPRTMNTAPSKSATSETPSDHADLMEWKWSGELTESGEPKRDWRAVSPSPSKMNLAATHRLRLGGPDSVTSTSFRSLPGPDQRLEAGDHIEKLLVDPTLA